MTPGSSLRRWDFAAILLSMLAMTGFFLLFQNSGFQTLDFIDPDDALRLVEVRDWMAGQSWFDVSQHRINPPLGGEMHWWRMLDVPIAAMILFFRLFLGGPEAEHVALILWPLLLYGLFLLLLRQALRQLGGNILCWIGLLLPVSMIFLIRQFAPLRIDHHGWQVVAATALLALSLGRPNGRRGAVAGVVMAFYLSISLEALPYFLLFGGLYAWQYWRDAQSWPMLRNFLLACSAGVLVSLPASRGWSALFVTHCDGLSAPYLGALTAASVTSLLAARLIGHNDAVRRIGLMALTGIAALAAFLLVAPQCSSGPFGSLDPIVRQYWYLHVLEGLPLWRQDPNTAIYSILPSAMGLVGGLLAMRHAAESLRPNWRRLFVLQLGAAAVSVLVMRAMYVSHAFAVPGCAFLVLSVWHRARRIETVPTRIVASVAVIFAFPTVPLAIISKIDSVRSNAHEDATELRVSDCFQTGNIARLNRIAPATFFAPIDVGPSILTDTRHSVLATGHHRNQAAMATVIGGYLADDEHARRLVMSSTADLLLICRGTQEMDVYTGSAPDGLAARLLRGRVPPWLVPLPQQAGSPYLIYRIRR